MDVYHSSLLLCVRCARVVYAECPLKAILDFQAQSHPPEKSLLDSIILTLADFYDLQDNHKMPISLIICEACSKPYEGPASLPRIFFDPDKDLMTLVKTFAAGKDRKLTCADAKQLSCTDGDKILGVIPSLRVRVQMLRSPSAEHNCLENDIGSFFGIEIAEANDKDNIVFTHQGKEIEIVREYANFQCAEMTQSYSQGHVGPEKNFTESSRPRIEVEQQPKDVQYTTTDAGDGWLQDIGGLLHLKINLVDLGEEYSSLFANLSLLHAETANDVSQILSGTKRVERDMFSAEPITFEACIHTKGCYKLQVVVYCRKRTCPHDFDHLTVLSESFMVDKR